MENKNLNIFNVSVADNKYTCIVCNKESYGYDKSIGSNFCSWHCYEHYKSNTSVPNCECIICGKKMYLKPSRIKRAKNGITCSKECCYKLKENYMSGEGNHQFGVKGMANSSFTNERRLNQYGYVMLYIPDHPLADNTGRYREHRYIVELNFNLFPINYFNIINDYHILKDEYLVHHKDRNKTNNNINNLLIISRSEHSKLHNLEDKVIIRDDITGRIIGVVKSGEFGGNLVEDNTEPSNMKEYLIIDSSIEGVEHSK